MSADPGAAVVTTRCPEARRILAWMKFRAACGHPLRLHPGYV